MLQPRPSGYHPQNFPLPFATRTSRPSSLLMNALLCLLPPTRRTPSPPSPHTRIFSISHSWHPVPLLASRICGQAMVRIAQCSFYLALINYSFLARLLIRCFGSSSAWQPLPVQSLSADLRRGRQPVLPSVRSGSAESFLQRYDGGMLIRSCVLALLSDALVRICVVCYPRLYTRFWALGRSAYLLASRVNPHSRADQFVAAC